MIAPPEGRSLRPRDEWSVPPSPDVQDALSVALEQAVELRHGHLGTEHMLLGILYARFASDDGAVKELFVHPGLSMETARDALVRIMGRGDGMVAPIKPSPRAQTVLKMAEYAACAERSAEVRLGHLLWALLHSGGCAGRVLEDVGMPFEAFAEMMDRLEDTFSGDVPA